MRKAKMFFFGFAAFLILAVITHTLGLGSTLSTLLGYVGGIAFLASEYTYGWIEKIGAKT